MRVNLSPYAFSRLLSAYVPAFHDGHTVDDFSMLLARSLVFESQNGYAIVEQPYRNGSARVHGAKWSVTEPAPAIESFKALMLALLQHLELGVIQARVPVWHSDTIRIIEGAGFTRVGALPLEAFWGGKPMDLLIYALWRPQL
jgi:hypothetical protein